MSSTNQVTLALEKHLELPAFYIHLLIFIPVPFSHGKELKIITKCWIVEPTSLF